MKITREDVLRVAELANLENLGQGLDAGSVELVELFAIGEDGGELRTVGLDFGLCELEIGQFGNAQHVFASDVHTKLIRIAQGLQEAAGRRSGVLNCRWVLEATHLGG